jgi:cytochrome b subunit of formate dehydrogenase
VGIIAEMAKSPWGQDVPVHAAFYLIYVAAIAAFCFFIVHTVWLRYYAKPMEFSGHTPASEVAKLPEKIQRHSLAARLFHMVMAASMLTLLFTAFLPKVGLAEFDWVKWHWIAGIVLIASILFHLIHATFFMDFWSIWPDKIDIHDAFNRMKRFRGEAAPPPRRFAKYPLENKMYHLSIVFAGLAVAITGFFMLFRIRTPIFTRNSYLFGDMTWGLTYLLHGLSGIALIALIAIHIYMALRPEKLVISKSMVFGTLDREHYVEHHDPERWAVTK